MNMNIELNIRINLLNLLNSNYESGESKNKSMNLTLFLTFELKCQTSNCQPEGELVQLQTKRHQAESNKFPVNPAGQLHFGQNLPQPA